MGDGTQEPAIAIVDAKLLAGPCFALRALDDEFAGGAFTITHGGIKVRKLQPINIA